jgi:hypothetical protein
MDELLRAISQSPDIIDAYTRDQVAAAQAALAEFRGAVAEKTVTADADALTEAIALAAKLTERSEALDKIDAEFEAKVAELDAALGITPEEVEDIVEEVEAVTEGPDPVDEPAEDGEDTEEEVEDKVLEEVVASVKPSIGKLASVVPADRKPKDSDNAPALIAAGGPGEGKPLTASAFAEMALQRWQRGFADDRITLASIETKHKYSLRKGDDAHNIATLAKVADEDAAQGNLVAAGGFCAPPQVLYSFFNIATRAGILNLPTVNAPRGSISLPVSPSLGDFIGQTGIATEWTNTNDIEPTSPATKPPYVFVCPEFQDCEVSAWPTIQQFGNFAGRFFPEAIANSQQLALIAADREINAARIAFLVAAAVAGNVSSTGGGTLVNLAHNLASNASDYRATYGMAFDAVLDVVLPHWVRDAAYADAITRDSTNGSSLNAWLGAMFSELNLRPQFVYDLDPQTDGLFELEANVLMYAPGTVVELDGGTLDLGVVRDSDLNSLNNFQTFVEPFIGWCVPGHEIRSLTINVCANGSTGDRVDIACPTVS